MGIGQQRKSQEMRPEVNEMRMLGWMYASGVTKKDNIRNEHVRGSVEVARARKHVRCTSRPIRKEKERKTENQVEILV